MEIKEITVSASMSRSYQKAEFSVVAEIESEDEREYVKRYCVEQASQLLDQIEAEVNKVPAQPVSQPAYQPKPAYNKPVQNNNGYYDPQMIKPRQNNYGGAPYAGNVPPSQKQIDYLHNLGYTGQIPATKHEADLLLQQLKSNRR